MSDLPGPGLGGDRVTSWSRPENLPGRSLGVRQADQSVGGLLQRLGRLQKKPRIRGTRSTKRTGERTGIVKRGAGVLEMGDICNKGKVSQKQSD